MRGDADAAPVVNAEPHAAAELGRGRVVVLEADDGVARARAARPVCECADELVGDAASPRRGGNLQVGEAEPPPTPARVARATPIGSPVGVSTRATQREDSAVSVTEGTSSRAGVGIAESAAVWTTIRRSMSQPRAASAASTGAARGSGTVTRGRSPRAAYHRVTASIAASSAHPGSPMGRAERVWLVGPPARRTQSPSRSWIGAGHASATARATAIVSAAEARRGGGIRLAR